MPDVELVPEGGSAEKGDDEEARQLILQVKKTIERCLEQRMNKAEMFRVIREEGLSTWIAFAVYKELREQNYGFFKEYYGMQDQKEQREKLDRLIQAYRTGRGNASLAAGTRAPETATTKAAAMETDATATMECSGERACFDEEINRLLASSSTGAGGQFAGGAALPQPAVPSPVGRQLHDDNQPTVYQEWLRAMTWAEEAAPTRQGMHIHEQSLANGMFQGHVYFPAGQQPGYLLEQAAQLPVRQQLHYQEQNLPAGQWPHYQQQAVHLQQLVANGGFQTQGAPLRLAAGLPSNNNVMDSWPQPLDGIGWGHEQQCEHLLQRWPGAGADPSPSPTLPGAELLGKHYQNFHRSNNAGFHERS